VCIDINKLLEDEARDEHSDFELDINEKKDNNIIDVNSLLKSNISKNSVSMSFETIVAKFNEFYFMLPKYQRKYVWDREQISNLALSMIKNIPIPPIYVYFNDKDNKYVILDGQQRVISLFLYFYNLNVKRTKEGNKILVDFYELLKNVDDRNAKLLDILRDSASHHINNTRYKIRENGNEVDITYKDLSPEAKRMLGSKYIEVVFLDIKSAEKEKVYSNIFKLLNSAGTPLKPQEIRNGVFQSEFYDRVHELNNNNNVWRNLYGEKHENSRDVELLLRFLAIEHFTEFGEDKREIKFRNDFYKGSYHILLDDFSQKSIKFDSYTIEKYINNLNLFFSKFNLTGSLYENRKNKSINHLLLEALYVAFIKLDKNIGEFNENTISLILDNDKYKESSKNSTSNKSNIESRINAAYEVLKNENR